MLNHITLMGRMVRDPELRKTGSGISVVSFTVACDRDFSSKESTEKEVDFIDCTAWRNTADFVSKYFTKGRMIVVDGRLQIRKWQDKDGNNRYSAEVLANSCYFGDSKRDSDGNTAPATAASGYPVPPAPGQNFAPITVDESTLPF